MFSTKHVAMLIVTTAALAVSLTACSTAGSGPESVEIEFFQHKQEAVATYDALIEKFEAANPNITVNQVNRPNDPSYLKSRAATNDLPDVLGVGGTAEFAGYVDAGLIEPVPAGVADNVYPQYIDSSKALTGTDELFAIPYTANAQTTLYNVALFEENGLTVPTTWSEFLDVAEQIQDLGAKPFVFGYKDSWTINIPVNEIGAQLISQEKLATISSGTADLEGDFGPTLEKVFELSQFGREPLTQYGYDDANAAFANGESFMYNQGIWAISALRAINPDLELGAFSLPATEDAADNMLVVGVDQMLAVSANSEHKEAANAFVGFLLQESSVSTYLEQQQLLPTISGATQSDPTLATLDPYLNEGRIIGGVSDQFPAGFDPTADFQGGLITGDVAATLKAVQLTYETAIANG
jgi:raffinose/stachyose/melibiose transport system substrate-binding protein